MSVTERTKKALRDFGLTEYEVKAYVSLVEGGSMPASELSKVASVPYSKVYEILGNLERKGWIESEQGRPSKYYAKSPSTALEAPVLAPSGSSNSVLPSAIRTARNCSSHPAM